MCERITEAHRLSPPDPEHAADRAARERVYRLRAALGLPLVGR